MNKTSTWQALYADNISWKIRNEKKAHNSTSLRAFKHQAGVIYHRVGFS